jgi:hypothetical protein
MPYGLISNENRFYTALDILSRYRNRLLKNISFVIGKDLPDEDCILSTFIIFRMNYRIKDHPVSYTRGLFLRLEN